MHLNEQLQQGDEAQQAAVLSQYEARSCTLSFSPHAQAAWNYDPAGAWDRILSVLLRSGRAARQRLTSCAINSSPGTLMFTATLALCLPSLCRVELGKGFSSCADGTLLPLAELPGLSSLAVSFRDGTKDSLQRNVMDAANLTGLTRLRFSFNIGMGDVDYGDGTPALVQLALAPLGALTRLHDLAVVLLCADDDDERGGPADVFRPQLNGAPTSLRRLTLAGGSGACRAVLDAAACRAVGGLTNLEHLVAGPLRPGPGQAGRLPASLRSLTLDGLCLSDVVDCVPALELLTPEARVNVVVTAGSPNEPLLPLRALRSVAARVTELSLALIGSSLSSIASAELQQFGASLRRLTLRRVHASTTPADDVQLALLACQGLQTFSLSLAEGSPSVSLVRQVLLGAPRLQEVTIMSAPGLGPAACWPTHFLAVCLATRAVASSQPALKLSTDQLTEGEAAALQAELRAAGHRGLTLQSVPRRRFECEDGDEDEEA